MQQASAKRAHLDRLVPGSERAADGRRGNLVERAELLALPDATDLPELALGEPGETDTEASQEGRGQRPFRR